MAPKKGQVELLQARLTSTPPGATVAVARTTGRSQPACRELDIREMEIIEALSPAAPTKDLKVLQEIVEGLGEAGIDDIDDLNNLEPGDIAELRKTPSLKLGHCNIIRKYLNLRSSERTEDVVV